MRERLHGRGDWLIPDWPAPSGVRAFVTTRDGGVSDGAYASLNLGLRSGDEPHKVARNRSIVRAYLPAAPVWMTQVHGARVLDLDCASSAAPLEADAAVSRSPERVCAVLTADCMPLLLCDDEGHHVGVAHAGWRGIAAGVIENSVGALGVAPSRLMAWMGPAIGPQAFEVGAEVREALLAGDAHAQAAFSAHTPGKFKADLYALARRRLARMGVVQIYGGGFCTYFETERFFSYRREKQSGRMGAFIWQESVVRP